MIGRRIAQRRKAVGTTAWLASGLLCTVIAGWASAQSDEADEPAIFRDSGCHGCHSVDTLLLGPPYRAIAALHAARKDVMIGVLAQKIIVGGGGNWGVVPMVPNEHVTEAQARQMAEWILRLGPTP